MYISPNASRIRQREAQRARDNRAEIVKARSLGQITRRDLISWGIFTAGGVLVCKNGLSPLAPQRLCRPSPRAPRAARCSGRKKFAQPLNRLNLQHPGADDALSRAAPKSMPSSAARYASEPHARRLSYHTDFSTPPPGTTKADFTNPITGRGPMEGRPPGEIFAHQRWDEFFPKDGYVFIAGRSSRPTRASFPNVFAESRPQLPLDLCHAATATSTRRRDACRRR